MLSAQDVTAAEQQLTEVAGSVAAAQAKLAHHDVLKADTPARRAMRLARVAAQETHGEASTARAVVLGGVVAERPPMERPAAPAVSGADRLGETTLAIERVLGTNDLMSVTYLDGGLRAAETVGRISIRSRAHGGPEGYGTGFLVSPRVVLTNHHVLPSAAVAQHSQVEFEFQERLDGPMASSVFLQLDPDAFFATDAALDYTFVAVRDPGNATAAYGWNPLIEAEGKLTTDEYVSIIQHPEGQPKQLALRENRVVGILEQHVLYTTDTAPGSSGSPVFNDQWEVVALHHSGVPRKNAAGQWLARDGRVWTAAMGEQQIDWIANEGVRISRIIAHVQGTHLTGMNEAQRGLWTACFEVPRRERREDSRISPPVPPVFRRRSYRPATRRVHAVVVGRRWWRLTAA